jgi:hypothetical protein
MKNSIDKWDTFYRLPTDFYNKKIIFLIKKVSDVTLKTVLIKKIIFK